MATPSLVSILLLSIFFLGLSVSVSVSGRRMALVGGWKPIEDISDPHIQELGRFAITEHNGSHKTNLVFSKVIKGESQVVEGLNYRLVVVAIDGISTNNYEAVVWEKPREGDKSLTSFKQV